MAFNESQNIAVDHSNGPLLVLAGPGSGKTTVITHRAKKLIVDCGVNPSNILVITFTRAAALEMQERFQKLIGKRTLPVTFGTFHAVYFKILKYAYNYSTANILKEEQKIDILKEIIIQLKLELDDEGDFISALISEISLVKGDMMDITHYYSKNCSEAIFKKIYSMYNDRLIRSNLIDFDDMLVMCYELLTKREDILQLWQNKYQYILIDEFQDISRVQYEIIKLLAKPQDNLFIVGDDDQSIYRFRGAKPEIMLNFKKDYPQAKQILLDTNYRSTKEILHTANRLIEKNNVRFSKKIKSDNDIGKPVDIKEFKNQQDESTYVLRLIDSYLKNGLEYNDIAVLYRTNTNPRLLVEKLMEYNIPFKIKDTIPNIYDHWMTKNIIAYIKIALGDSTRKSFLQIINRPKRYIARDAFQNPIVDLDDIREYYEDKSYVTERVDRLEYDLNMLEKMNPYAAINYIRKGIGYDDYVKEYASFRRIKEEDLFELLDELQETARNYPTYSLWFEHIEKYGEELKKQVKDRFAKKDGIELATMHSSKGLEYKTVIIIDALEGVTPHKRAVLPEDIEEERRLFYVAMTRAILQLHIFYPIERYGKDTKPSRFVEEIRSNDDKKKR